MAVWWSVLRAEARPPARGAAVAAGVLHGDRALGCDPVVRVVTHGGDLLRAKDPSATGYLGAKIVFLAVVSLLVGQRVAPLAAWLEA
jgi:hypothetical protein